VKQKLRRKSAYDVGEVCERDIGLNIAAGPTGLGLAGAPYP
jgi:hypothetical protein